MTKTWQRLFLIALALAVLVVIGDWARERLGLELEVESVRAFAEGLGAAGPILFVFLVAGRSLLALPSQVVLIAAGLCFGTLVGTIVGGTGLMISGLVLFLVARYAGRASIEKRVGPRGQRILEFASHRSGAVTLAIACGYPLAPLSPIQAAAGLTRMPIFNFVIAALVGGSIRASIFAYFGNSLVDASWTSLIGAAILFIFAAAVPLAFPRGRAWLREMFRSAPKSEEVQ